MSKFEGNSSCYLLSNFLRFCIFFALCLFFICQIYFFYDLLPYEYFYFYELLGFEGILVFIFIDGGFIYIFLNLIYKKQKEQKKISSRIFLIVLIIWFLILLWLFEWVFLEYPLTIRVNEYLSNSSKNSLIITDINELNNFSLYTNIKNHEDKEKFLIMYERIRFNRTELYRKYNIGKLIDYYSDKYNVDAELLFYWLYLDSFWGEAVSGKLPFTNELTAETFRDLIQVHLPYWFVESSIRSYLINNDLLQKIFGEYFGGKLRYAFQKSTYDISMEPYEANTFTDTFLIIQKYQSEFGDIFKTNSANILNREIRESFQILNEKAAFNPCNPIYSSREYNAEYYKKFRNAFIRFSRGIFYKTLLDLDFATKVQSLVIRHVYDNYIENLGPSTWSAISRQQKISMVAILRDVFTPNIGKSSQNLYNLPEFNCSPMNFVTDEAIKNKDVIINNISIWRPQNYNYLWAAATKKLSVLSEVNLVVNGEVMPGISPSKTINEASELLKIRRDSS